MKVEIWSDVTCPHCYIAKRKFEMALSQFKDRDKIKISWRSFELAPGFKTDPNKFLPQFLQELHGTSMEQVQGMIHHVEARQTGITSVPIYVFNTNSKVSGGVDSKVYLEILEKEFALSQTLNLKAH